MSIYLGIDIGSVSIKAGVVGRTEDKELFSKISRANSILTILEDEITTDKLESLPLLVSGYKRIKGKPIEATLELLRDIDELLPFQSISGVRVTGSGSKLIGQLLNANIENEFKAIAKGIELLYPDVKTVFEMGGETSKFLRLEHDSSSGAMGISDYETNGDCAAGTGSFMDQQALRLKYKIEDVGEIVRTVDKSASIAGRCSVFAKSDMIHAQQKGYTPPEILKGLCEAVARNFKSAITKGKKVEPKVAFIGGVAVNAGIVGAMENVFNLERGSLFIPRYHAWLGAIGAALLEKNAEVKTPPGSLSSLDSKNRQTAFPTSLPLDMEKVTLLRERIKPYHFDNYRDRIDAYLGIDVGSVSTNLAVIDVTGNVIKEIYLRTDARPIEVVNNGLKEIKEEIGHKIRINGVGTTGSGRELIGELIGADTINDEITAHKTGASYIGEKLLDLKVDTIFEIGGQDSKFISLEDDIVVDFAMNEACAAGTGSFLEERAEELDISIKDQFANLALGSKNPIKLGERCTVFMEQDVKSYQQRGAAKDDLVAGLAYSVGYNYINRVVRGRKIGEVIFFQGGTAYNDSVAAAFSKILNKEIIVPPHNGVIGAVGAALLAKEKMTMTDAITNFRGYSLEEIDYTLREFTCKACTNFCNIQEFRVEGEKTFWGDKCSDKFRKKAKVDTEPVIPDLFTLRQQIMFEDYEERSGSTPIIGFPRAMDIYEKFPFWNTFFTELGFGVVLSDETNGMITNAGLDAVVAEPCFPVKIAHGHVKQLLDKGVDFVFLPNIINSETSFKDTESHLCPWNQTLPFVINHAPVFREFQNIILKPHVKFRDGKVEVGRQLAEFTQQLGISKSRTLKAVESAYKSQGNFYNKLLDKGKEALEILAREDEIGIILVGRNYNIYDRGVNISVATKLRDYYGVNVIPLDFLPLDKIDISDVNDNMFWNSGRRILAAAKFVKEHPNLHLIYITNFKCGPDSYIKHFMTKASGKPFLTLQFDAHANDAGVMTRCEAYLDSKGVLRWWRRAEKKEKMEVA